MLQLKVIDAADVPAVLALQAACYAPAFHESAEAFEAKVRATRGLHCSFLAVQGGEALGYIVSLPVDEGQLPGLDALDWQAARAPRTMYLHDLAVSPAGREQRLGHKLVEQVLRRARDMGLAQVALVAVQGSQAYWQRLGFAQAPAPLSEGLQQKLDSFGPGACLMQRTLVAA
ncbi:Predicted N-acetyltransferase YhbS [Roseateles sp. YR242]|uniref:GNAT family N-acetyltransferase n=1 Tax=Roseateles sp. YR242 TaxID=1855305 RepID=UPI0008C33753|nr:GNAT family N-acetyltransferase [Roseateles sp. YR242]SEK34811.1 Predicted N-acetyltransferase YhbS [Roseateles sp. YR242]